MRSRLPRGSAWLALLLAVASCEAPARSLKLEAQRLDDARVHASQLRVELVEQADAARLRVSAKRLEVPLLQLDGEVEWTCELRRAGPQRTCNGPLHFDGASAELAASLDLQRFSLELRRDQVRVGISLPLAANLPTTMDARELPASWIARVLDAWWPAGELRGGVFELHAARAPDESMAARFSVQGLALNTRDGATSVAGVDVAGELAARPIGGGWQVDAGVKLDEGEMHAGNLRVALPPEPVEATLAMRRHEDGRIQVDRLGWRDAGTLEFEAAFELQPAELAPLRRLDARVDSAVLPGALERYAAGLLAQQGLAGLSLDGTLAATLEVGEGGAVERIAFQTTRLDLRESASGLALEGVRGGIDWAAGGERPAQSLAWKRGRVGAIELPAVAARWQSRAGALHLVGDLHAKLLGGNLHLARSMLDPLVQADGDRFVTDFAFDRIGHDSADGTLAAANLAARGQLRISGTPAEPRLRANARLLGGEALAGAVYVKLPEAGVDIELDALRADTTWQVERFGWRDAGTLDFDARAQIEPGSDAPLRALRIDLHEARLSKAVERYARSWLAAKGQAGLVADGSLSGQLEFGHDGLHRLVFNANDVGITASGGSWAFRGVDGGIDWEGATGRPPTTLAWHSGALFGIPFGGAHARLQSLGGTITLARPIAIDVLGGELEFERLSMQPGSSLGERYTASVSLGGIEMPQLSAVLGWPVFPGKLSGGIPEVVFSGDTIALHGGLDLYVFDGHLGLNSLVLERPFGVAPSLGANIHFENLDLEQVTSAFSFGGMSGRLFGTINDLRLVDWSPVAFDAWLRTKGGGRMSYKAVDDLTSIGGGMSGGLQTMALKLFDTFGYRQLGLRCRLREQVCLMGGIDPVPAAADSRGGGYTIVQGSGVPRISIVGHRRQVDWPTLVSRLEEATRGQGPVVE